jgi:uncharacterized protein YqhQ
MKQFFRFFFSLPLFAFLAAPKNRKVGGQAIMEGVMMRGKEAVSWAVRKNNDEVVVEKEQFISVSKKIKILGWPLLRGTVSLFESMGIGFKALARSAEILEEEQKKKDKAEGKTVKEKNKTGEKIASFFSLSLSLALAFGVFMYLPMWILSHFVPKESALLFNTLSGALRIVFFLLYLIAISLWKEIRRVFEYHGAEHMAIFAFEDYKSLTVENMRNYTTYHPRCGTSFLFLVGIVCILLFAIVDAVYINFFGPYPIVLTRFAVHITLIPFVSGTSFEVLKLSDKYQHIPIVGLLIKPGLLLQKITTKPPDDSQLEVAASALKAVV